jgi:small subunit ribosomal protein SAe
MVNKSLNSNQYSFVTNTYFSGINLINIGKTWEKLIFAARVIAAIENVS